MGIREYYFATFVLVCIFAGSTYAENRLVYGDLDRIIDINPITGGGFAERRLQQLMFNGLIQVRREVVDDGTRSDLVYTGVLAEDFNYDRQTQEYIFDLRTDVRFHNGASFSVSDVYSTVELLLDNDTDVGTSFFRNYIERCIPDGTFRVRFRLKRQPFDVWKLFTFGVCSDGQIAQLGDPGLNKEAQGRNWWSLDIVKNPVGTGPFKLSSPVTISSALDRIDLNRFGSYFESQRSRSSDGEYIQEIAYQSYAASTMSTLMNEFSVGRIINFSAQSFGVDTELYHTLEYGNDSIYYIGFNYRPSRKIHVVQPGRNTGDRELLPIENLYLKDILSANDTIGGEPVGRLFRRYIMQGLDRAELLRRVESTAATTNVSTKMENRLQRSVFPVNTAFSEDVDVQRVGKEFLPQYLPQRPFDRLNSILNRYLQEQDKSFFKFVPAAQLQEFADRRAVTDIGNGLFMSVINPSSYAFALRMIYLATDRAFYDFDLVASSLIEQFAKMGIALIVDSIPPSHFYSEVERGDWDLIFTSYHVPPDFDISAAFSMPNWNKDNMMFYQNNEIERIVDRLANQASSIGFANSLKDLNEAIMKDMPAILLFGVPQKAAFRRGLFATDIEQLRRFSSNEHLFDYTERWQLR